MGPDRSDCGVCGQVASTRCHRCGLLLCQEHRIVSDHVWGNFSPRPDLCPACWEKRGFLARNSALIWGSFAVVWIVLILARAYVPFLRRLGAALFGGK
jgi:hypothetical protein